ncbi:MAG TPA: ATP synthase F0 subunit B [Candidatus Baltobacteraceae bacterium]
MSFLSLDGTFWIQLINFAIFFAVLNVVFLRPVGVAVGKRREYLDGLVARRDALQHEASTLRAQAEAVRQAARREAEITLSKTRADVSNETAEIATQYNAKSATQIAAAQATAASEFDAALAQAERHAGDLAQLVVGRTFAEASR